jgi:hypothetical protein
MMRHDEEVQGGGRTEIWRIIINDCWEGDDRSIDLTQFQIWSRPGHHPRAGFSLPSTLLSSIPSLGITLCCLPAHLICPLCSIQRGGAAISIMDLRQSWIQ